MVDVKNLVTFHGRAARTAELVGIRFPRGRSRKERSRHSEEIEDESESGITTIESGSAVGSIRTIKSVRRVRGGGLPLPPSPTPPPNLRRPSGIPPASVLQTSILSPSPNTQALPSDMAAAANVSSFILHNIPTTRS